MELWGELLYKYCQAHLGEISWEDFELEDGAEWFLDQWEEQGLRIARIGRVEALHAEYTQRYPHERGTLLSTFLARLGASGDLVFDPEDRLRDPIFIRLTLDLPN